MDDAYYLLVEDSCSPAEKAQTLAGVALVAGLSRGELLAQYLDAVDTLIGLNSSSTDWSCKFLDDHFVDISIALSIAVYIYNESC